MKYIIKRSSLCDHEQPIEGCTKETVHFFDTRTNVITTPIKQKVWEVFNRVNRDIKQLPNGNWRGINKVPTEVWVADIDNLLSFVDECNDDIIISKPDCEEGYYCLEIYDDYRE